MELTKKEVEHLARLSRLALTQEEIETYSTQLSSVLGYVSQLKEVDTAGVEYRYQVEGLSNTMDKDEVDPSDEGTRNRIIDSFPDRAGDLLKVKSVFGD